MIRPPDHTNWHDVQGLIRAQGDQLDSGNFLIVVVAGLVSNAWFELFKLFCKPRFLMARELHLKNVICRQKQIPNQKCAQPE